MTKLGCNVEPQSDIIMRNIVYQLVHSPSQDLAIPGWIATVLLHHL